MEIDYFTGLLSRYSIILPLILVCIQWNKLPDGWAAIRWILIVSLLGDVIGYLTMVLFNNTIVVGNLYLLLQFSLLFYIFSNSNLLNKKLLTIVYSAFIVYYIIDISFFETVVRFLTNANTVSSVLVTLLMLYYLYHQLGNSEVINLYQLPMIWIALAFLLYYSISFFTFLAINYLAERIGPQQAVIWLIHNLSNILKNIFISVALWLNYKAIKSAATL